METKDFVKRGHQSFVGWLVFGVVGVVTFLASALFLILLGAPDILTWLVPLPFSVAVVYFSEKRSHQSVVRDLEKLK